MDQENMELVEEPIDVQSNVENVTEIETELDIEEIITEINSEEESEDQPEEPAEKNWQRTVLSYLHDLVFGLVGILLVFMFLFRMVVVSGPSMMQTLQDGDSLILLSNVLYRNPKYGDIVVASKESFKSGEPIIKRVIATEGQTVDIDFVEGIVYVDGVALSEPYTNTPTNLFEGTVFPLTVEEGHVFVLGDNRNDSMDSRSGQIGQIDKRELLGKAIFLALPGQDVYTGKRDFKRIGALW